MSRFTNRAMSEYELAAHVGLMIALRAIVRLGGDQQLIATELHDAILVALEDGATNRASCLRAFADTVERMAAEK